MDKNNHQVPVRVTDPFRWILTAITNWFVIIASSYFLYFVFNQLSFDTQFLLSIFIFCFCVIFVWIIYGTRQHSLATLGHDGGHGCVTQNTTLNDTLTNLFVFYPFGVSIERFRTFHFAHHNNLGTSKDTELILKKMASPTHDLPMIGKRSVGKLLLRDFLGLSYKEIFEFLFIFTTPRTFSQAFGVVVWWSLFIGSIFYSKVYFIFYFVLLWFISLGTSFWGFFRMRTLTEHTGTAGIHRCRPTRLQEFFLFPYKVWCHYEHHAYPHIAATKLPAIRKTLDTHVPEVSLSHLYESYKHTPKILSGAPLAEMVIEK